MTKKLRNKTKHVSIIFDLLQNTHINEERNDQHDDDELNALIAKRRQNKILDVVPEVHLNEQRRNQLDNAHQSNVDPRLIDP